MKIFLLRSLRTPKPNSSTGFKVKIYISWVSIFYKNNPRESGVTAALQQCFR